MRVALDCRKYEDFGIGSYLRGLVRGFAQLSPPPKLDLVGLPESAPRPPVEAWPVHPCSAPGYSLREQLSLPRLALGLDADLWHFPHYVVPLMHRSPFVATVHDVIHLKRSQDRSPLAYPYALLFLNRALTHARRIITATRTAAQELAALAPDAADRVRIVPHAVSAELLEEPSDVERAQLLERIGGEPSLLYVGNDLPHKNLELVVRALPDLRESLGPDGRFVVVGPQPSPDRPWLKLARELGVDSLVKPLGRLDTPLLRAAYGECRVFVFPSREEGYGLPPMEALAQGAPVLASRIAVLQEVLGAQAEYFDPDDPGTLASLAAATLARIPDRAKRQARMAYARRFRWQHAARLTLRVYEEAA